MDWLKDREVRLAGVVISVMVIGYIGVIIAALNQPKTPQTAEFKAPIPETPISVSPTPPPTYTPPVVTPPDNSKGEALLKSLKPLNKSLNDIKKAFPESKGFRYGTQQESSDYGNAPYIEMETDAFTADLYGQGDTIWGIHANLKTQKHVDSDGVVVAPVPIAGGKDQLLSFLAFLDPAGQKQVKKLIAPGKPLSYEPVTFAGASGDVNMSDNGYISVSINFKEIYKIRDADSETHSQFLRILSEPTTSETPAAPVATPVPTPKAPVADSQGCFINDGGLCYFELHKENDIAFHDAEAYCKSKGGRLPDENQLVKVSDRLNVMYTAINPEILSLWSSTTESPTGNVENPGYAHLVDIAPLTRGKINKKFIRGDRTLNLTIGFVCVR